MFILAIRSNKRQKTVSNCPGALSFGIQLMERHHLVIKDRSPYWVLCSSKDPQKLLSFVDSETRQGIF